jgi:hypothetical protein
LAEAKCFLYYFINSFCPSYFNSWFISINTIPVDIL